jgi:hypothetical protein
MTPGDFEQRVIGPGLDGRKRANDIVAGRRKVEDLRQAQARQHKEN